VRALLVSNEQLSFGIGFPISTFLAFATEGLSWDHLTSHPLVPTSSKRPRIPTNAAIA
jgi:hypothetical protein